MNPSYTKETWLNAYHELLSDLAALGVPEEVGKYIAQNLHSERAIRRMIGYLRAAHPTRMEEIADEMLAIMEDWSSWIRKKEAQESNAKYNAWLNSPLRESGD